MLACRAHRLAPARNKIRSFANLPPRSSTTPPSKPPSTVSSKTTSSSSSSTPPLKQPRSNAPLLFALGFGIAVPAALYASEDLREALLPESLQRLFDDMQRKDIKVSFEEKVVDNNTLKVLHNPTAENDVGHEMKPTVPNTHVGVALSSSLPSTEHILIPSSSSTSSLDSLTTTTASSSFVSTPQEEQQPPVATTHEHHFHTPLTLSPPSSSTSAHAVPVTLTPSEDVPVLTLEEIKEMDAKLTALEESVAARVEVLGEAATLVETAKTPEEAARFIDEKLTEIENEAKHKLSLDELIKEEEVRVSPHAGKSLAETQAEVFKTVMQEQAPHVEPALAAVVKTHIVETEHTLEAKLADVRAEVNAYLEELLRNKSNPAEVKAEFASLLKTAETKAKEEFAEVLKAQAESMQSKYQESVQGLIEAALTKQDALIAEFLDYAVEERVKDAASVIREEYEREKQERMADLHALKIEAKAFEDVFSNQSKAHLSTEKLLRLSNALLAVNQAVNNSTSFETAWKALREAATEDEMLSVAVNMVPECVATHGAPSVNSLKRKFRSVERAGCTASFLPPNPSFYGYLLAQVFGFLTFRERELLPGSDDHARLSRAGYFMKQGDLPHVLAELEQLSPAVKQVCQDWQREATERLVLDQALDLIRSRIQALRLALE